MLLDDCSIELTFDFFVYLFFVYLNTVKPIQLLIAFKLFIQSFLGWLFTCVYHIYCIIVHWSWNLSSGVIENRQWSVYKLDIQICFPRMILEGSGEVVSVFYFTFRNQYIDLIQGSSSSYSSLKLYI